VQSVVRALRKRRPKHPERIPGSQKLIHFCAKKTVSELDITLLKDFEYKKSKVIHSLLFLE